MLSPILLPNETKNELQTKGLRRFYLVETSSGLQGIVGAINPAALNRVQMAVPDSLRLSKNEGQVFHAVYWSELGLPRLNIEKTEVRSNGFRVSWVAESSGEVLANFLARTTTCPIGGERRLDEARAAGETAVPVVLWNADDPKLPWLPCHRVLRDVEWYQSGWMVCLAREHMFFKDVTAELLEETGSKIRLKADSANALLRAQGDERVTLLALSKDGAWRIHSQAGWADGILEHVDPSLREVAVIQLHSIILPKGLSLPSSDGSQEERITVVHSTQEAVADLNEGAQVAYLLSPIRSAKLQELVQHGQMLPAMSVALDVAALEGWMDAK